MTVGYLSLGSNQGDRLAFLQGAVRSLNATPDLRVDAVSSVYETAPVGYTEQPAFLNAVARIETQLAPEQLLDRCQDIEREFHRTRVLRWGPRTLDIDILLLGERAIDSERLTVPHPRLSERAFVVVPLAELAPDLELFTGREKERAMALADRLAKDPAQAMRLAYPADEWIE